MDDWRISFWLAKMAFWRDYVLPIEQARLEAFASRQHRDLRRKQMQRDIDRPMVPPEYLAKIEVYNFKVQEVNDAIAALNEPPDKA